MTWAYFSVSATWNWRQPRPDDDLGEARHDERRKGDRDRQALLVLGQRHDLQVAGAPGRGRTPSKSRVDERVRQLPRAVGPEVEVDDDVAVADAAVDARDDASAARTRRSRRAA